MKIPQANDVAKVLDIPLAVKQGDRTAKDIAGRHNFERRQAFYYLEAAALLGLILRRDGQYLLSKLGQVYVRLTEPQRKEIIARQMISLPVFSVVIRELLIAPLPHRLTHDDIAKLVIPKSGIHGKTIHRRVQSLFSWFSWLGDETGVFKVSKNSLTLLAPSTKFRKRGE